MYAGDLPSVGLVIMLLEGALTLQKLSLWTEQTFCLLLLKRFPSLSVNLALVREIFGSIAE